VLLEQPGELVTREELHKRLWPDDTFVDFEHGVNAAVKRLRATLGDSADSPRFVETVPRRGYRFIAPASVLDGPAARTGRGAGRWPLRWPWVIVGVGAAGAMVLGIWAFMKAPVQENAGENTKSAPGPVMRLTTGSGLNTEPAPSPDGEWVAYASDRSGEGHLDIWVQRLSGGEPVRLTRDAADEREPTFSADGSRIAFHSGREGGGIYVIPAHSAGEARLLVPGGNHGPVIVTVTAGTLTFVDDTCQTFDLVAGQSYIEPAGEVLDARLLPEKNPDGAAVGWLTTRLSPQGVAAVEVEAPCVM
jgi:hypothetical protein